MKDKVFHFYAEMQPTFAACKGSANRPKFQIYLRIIDKNCAKPAL